MNKKSYQKSLSKIKKRIYYFIIKKNTINYKIKNILFLLYFREDAIIKELIKIIIKKKK